MMLSSKLSAASNNRHATPTRVTQGTKQTLYLVLFGMLMTAFVLTDAASNDVSYSYRVVVDAGSSGTRAYIFRFTNDKDLNPIKIGVPEEFQVEGPNQIKLKVKPALQLTEGVANKRDLVQGEWEEGRKNLVKQCKKLFDNITTCIKHDIKNMHKAGKYSGSIPSGRTPVTVRLGATEGMRTYNRQNNTEGDEALMRTVRVAFRQQCKKRGYEFLGAEILHGHVEAMGAWVDAYCNPTGKHPAPEEMKTNFGIIELGGASLQIMSNAHMKHCFSSLGQDASMRKLANEYECSQDYILRSMAAEGYSYAPRYLPKDNKKDPLHKNFVFTEAGEETLKGLVEKHIFTKENIATIRSNLEGQQNYFLAGALYNFTKEFEHFDMKNPAHNLIEFVSDDKNPKVPEFKKCHREDKFSATGECENEGCEGKCEAVGDKFKASDRYVFYFLKKLFSLCDINIAKGAELNWARGLAIMQTHDITENMEMNREELRSLLNGLREKVNVPVRVFCKNCQTFEYTNDPEYTCITCDGDWDDKSLMSSADYETWSEQRSENSERSVSPMSAGRRLMNRLLQETHRRN